MYPVRSPVPMKLFALVLSLAIPLSAQELVRATELPRATLSELAAVPLQEQTREVKQRWLPPIGGRAVGVAGEAGQAGLPVLDSAAAPPAARIFLSDSSKQLSPADASGAVGPRHVVGAYNSGIVVHDRSGALLKKVGLSQFWFSSADAGTFYDPRIVYDARADRWVVASIMDEKAVMLAISENGDPAGAWRRYQIDERYSDFSHLVLTGDSIVAATMFWPGQHSIFYVVPRAAAYASPETLTATRIVTPDSVATPVASESDEELIVSADTDRISWRTVDGGAWQHADMPRNWGFPDPALPQLGGPALDGGLGYVENAVERNGWIYAVMTRAAFDGSRNSILWCRVNRTTGAAEWGSVTDAGGASYGYPSLAVNRSGAMLIGFGVFSASAYASSAYVYRNAFGVTSAPAILVQGDGPVTIGDRWGDYSATVVDPLDGSTFWTVQMHATKTAFWQTAWAKVDLGGKRRTARH